MAKKPTQVLMKGVSGMIYSDNLEYCDLYQ